MSKKATTSKQQATERVPKSNGAGKTLTCDAESGKFVERANDHMERAWGKIYDRSSKAGSSKR